MLSFKQKHDPYQAKICLEVGKYALTPIDAILPEICTFIVAFSCTAWTKMRSLRAN